MSDASSDDDKIEFVPTADLDRTRRNLLFATSVLFILTVTNPAKVVIPGFAMGEINVALAEAFTAVATIFFGYEYWLEFRLTHMRNNALLAGLDTGSLDKRLTRIRQAMTSLETQTVQARADIRAAIDALKVKVSPDLRTDSLLDEVSKAADILGSMRDKSFAVAAAENLERAKKSISEFREYTSRVGGRDDQKWGEVDNRMRALTVAIETNNRSTSQLVSSLDEVSRKVFGFQRTAFLMKDLLGVSLFSCSTLALASYRLGTRALAGLPPPDWGAWFAVAIGCAVGFWITARTWSRYR